MLLNDLLCEIEKRPSMYLASPSINYLHVFLNGYFLGQGKENSSEGLNELMLFQDWLARQKALRQIKIGHK